MTYQGVLQPSQGNQKLRRKGRGQHENMGYERLKMERKRAADE
jgi:hypothetical protein